MCTLTTNPVKRGNETLSTLYIITVELDVHGTATADHGGWGAAATELYQLSGLEHIHRREVLLEVIIAKGPVTL